MNLTLTDAKLKFAEIRKDRARIIIDEHAWQDHPERKFTRPELLELIAAPKGGKLIVNYLPKAKPDSFLWTTKDAQGQWCAICVLFEKVEGTDDYIIAISAVRTKEQPHAQKNRS